MSADVVLAHGLPDLRALRTLRYAVGATLAMGVAMGFDWPLAYLTPILALNFLASPDPCPNPRQGLAFVVVVAFGVFLGMLLSGTVLDVPVVYIPFVGLVLFRIFHLRAGGVAPGALTFLLISVTLIPLIGLMSPGVAGTAGASIVLSAAVALLVVWLTYLIFPDPPGTTLSQEEAAAPEPGAETRDPRARVRMALQMTAVVLPVLTVFYFMQWTGVVVVLIFVGVLSSQPGFASDPRKGVGLILGNAIGGVVAIIVYELLVFVPAFEFLLMLTLLCGLVFGARVFSGKPTGALFALAFSTVVLVIGSTTSGSSEAGGKAIDRVIQISVAVLYVVTAFTVIGRFWPEGKRA